MGQHIFIIWMHWIIWGFLKEYIIDCYCFLLFGFLRCFPIEIMNVRRIFGCLYNIQPMVQGSIRRGDKQRGPGVDGGCFLRLQLPYAARGQVELVDLRKMVFMWDNVRENGVIFGFGHYCCLSFWHDGWREECWPSRRDEFAFLYPLDLTGQGVQCHA